MIANYRNEFVWDIMTRDPYIRAGLERAGFTGGWLDAGKAQPAKDAEEAGKDADTGTDEATARVRPAPKPPARPNLQSTWTDCQHTPKTPQATHPHLQAGSMEKESTQTQN